MILYNDNIIGINIGNSSYKIPQLADDTALFLDGSNDSVLVALNTIEIFGTIYGLIVNTKTCLEWLGKKKHSKEKK